MSRVPQSEITFGPDSLSEEVEFALRELYEEVSSLRSSLGEDPKKDSIDLMCKVDSLEDRVREIEAICNALENNQLKIQLALQQLATKLDEEDVTNLDTDYTTNVNDNLFNE